MFEVLKSVIDDVRLEGEGVFECDLGDALVELHRLKARLESIEAHLTAKFDASRRWQLAHTRSAAAWLAWQTHMPAADAKRQVRVARALRAMPHTEQAWAAGEISLAHVAMLTKARTPVTARDFGRDEKLLVDNARDLRFKHFAIATRYWSQHADPDGAAHDAARQVDDRSMYHVQSLDGMWFGGYMLDPLRGAAFDTVLRRIVDELFDADWQYARHRLGRDPAITELPRTAAQRNADALYEMAIRAASAPRDARRPAPLLSVLVGYETFHGMLCELANGTVITPGSLRPLLTDADIERIVFDTPSRIIDIGAQRRLFTGALRHAILIRDRECYHPSCDVPADKCQVDHKIPYAAGGPTTLENGRAACIFHNLDRHRRAPPDHDP
jgi:hypothetical protein